MKFTAFQQEWGDLTLVDNAIKLMGWTFPHEHPYQRGGWWPDPHRKIQLRQATKLLSHAEWRDGWFRPDTWGWHLQRVIDELERPFELLSQPDARICHIRVGDLELKAKGSTHTYRLLYLSALGS